MDMIEVIEMRRSIRKYKGDAVPDQDILRLIESARLAPSGSNTQPWHEIIRDTSIATEHIMLTASSLGLGSCWVAWFTQNEIRPVLNIPFDKYVLGIITLGYADEQPAPRPRKTMGEILHYEQW